MLLLLGAACRGHIRAICASASSARFRTGFRRARQGADWVSASWVCRWRQTGRVEAKSQKGRSSLAAEAAQRRLLALIGERADLTSEEIRGLLGERGFRVGVSSIWRFFDRHGISFKKPCTPRSRSAPTWRRGNRGKPSSRSLIRQSWFSSTRPVRPPQLALF